MLLYMVMYLKFTHVCECVCIQYVYLKRLFVDIRFISHIRLPRLAKEYEFLKEENVTETFFLSECYKELILTYQLPLLI